MEIKLKNKVLQNILITFLIILSIIFLLFNISFNHTFKNYLNAVREERFDQFRSQLSYIIQNEDIQDLQLNIATYAYSENIEIEIADPNGESLAIFNELDGSEENLVQTEYKIIDNNETIAIMKVSYEESSLVNNLASDFRKRLAISLLISSLLAILIGQSISYVMSTRVSMDIEKLGQMAKDFRNNEYHKDYEINSDISEIKELYHDMAYLGDSLSKQKNLRRDYSQNISHELRTPLTNLLLTVEAIEDGIIEANSATIASIKEEIHHINALINKLRKAFNEESYVNENNIETFNLTDTLSKLTGSLYSSVRANGIKFDTKLEEDVYMDSDKDKLTQIIYNLLSNAFKACQAGDSVALYMKSSKNQVIISVIDSGLGISDEEIDKIFEKNYRINNEQNKNLSGSGLGLSISQDLAESLNGRIEVASQLGKGSEFTLYLPNKI